MIRTIFILLLSVASCLALDLVLEDGTVYKNIKLREKTDLGIKVYHETGIAFIDYQNLAEPDRLTFGYEESLYLAAKDRKATPAAAVSNNSQTTPQASIPTRSPNAVTDRGYVQKYHSPPEPAPTSSSAYSGGCAATTKKGYRCSRSAKGGSSYCWQHGD